MVQARRYWFVLVIVVLACIAAAIIWWNGSRTQQPSIQHLVAMVRDQMDPLWESLYSEFHPSNGAPASSVLEAIRAINEGGADRIEIRIQDMVFPVYVNPNVERWLGDKELSNDPLYLCVIIRWHDESPVVYVVHDGLGTRLIDSDIVPNWCEVD